MINNDTSVIPNGMYCYAWDDNDKFIVCPYHSLDQNHDRQSNGQCKFLGINDWDDDGLGLLWDMVKACDINDES